MPIYRSNVVLSNPNMGGTGINSWHVDVDNSVGLGDEALQNASEALETFYNSITQQCIASDTSITHDGDWTEVGGDQGAIATEPWSAPPYSAGSPFPAHLALVAGWGTDVRNRTGYGRTFIGPLRGQVNDARGTPSDAALTSLRGAMDALISASQGANGYAFVVYSRKLDAGRDFKSRTVHDQFAVLRSRRL